MNRVVRLVVLLLAVFCFSVHGADKGGKWKKAWKWSVAALIAGNAADVGSSFGGGVENNPMFAGPNGAFRPGRAIVIEAGLTAGVIALQHWLIKRYPEQKVPMRIFVASNFVFAGASGWVAGRNFTRPANARITPAIPMAP